MTSDQQQKPALDRRETYSYGTQRSHHLIERSSQTHAAFFTPYLQAGMTLVDCGCGPGTISIDLAAQVAPGNVLGIDIGEDALAKARELAASRGLDNIRFEQGSIYTIPCADASVDAVFIHAVLHHLSEPASALQEALRVLKPGGVLGVREPDFSGRILGPVGNSAVEMFDVWATMLQRNGGNPYLGRELRGLLHAASCQDIIATASCETHGTPESLEIFRTADPLTPEGVLGRGFLALGLVDEVGLAALRSGTMAWADDPGAFLARTWCEAVGWKA